MATIRVATEADIPTLRALADRIWRAYYPAFLSQGQIDHMLAWMYDTEVLRREMTKGVEWRLLLEGPEAVGFYSFRCDPSSKTAQLHKLYVLLELHGQGLGRQALEQLRTDARAAGAGRIELQVNRSNQRAIRAYERAGFKVAGAKVTDIGGGFVMDDFVMELEL